MSIGERIVELRKQQSISQGELAKALDVSRQAVSKWENDQTSPDTLNLIKLADLLNTQVEYLATGNFLPTPPPPPPVIVKQVQTVEKIVEVEKVVEIEKLVPIEKPVTVERVVERPVIRKVTRTCYLRNPIEFLLAGLVGIAAGILIGLLI